MVYSNNLGRGAVAAVKTWHSKIFFTYFGKYIYYKRKKLLGSFDRFFFGFNCLDKHTFCTSKQLISTWRIIFMFLEIFFFILHYNTIYSYSYIIYYNYDLQ